MSYKLSIIIPVYNAEPYLRRCLDSVLSQSLEKGEYEVLLINDGSSDRSLNICEEYKRKQPNVFSVITQENKGVSAARNRGIDCAKGEYITFLDADDCIVAGAYRWLIDNFYDSNVDKLMFWSITIDKHTSPTIPVQEDWKKIRTIDTTGRSFLQDSFDFSVVHSLYKRSFILQKNIRFDERQKIAEDVLFNLGLDLCNPTIKIIPLRFYWYFVNEGSAVVNRSVARCRLLVNNYVSLLSSIKVLSQKEMDVYGKDGLGSRLIEIGQSQLIPMTSRILSSNISSRELKDIRKFLEENGFLPFHTKNALNAVMTFIYRTPFLLIVYQFLFRHIFQKFILPYLRRN